MGTTVIIIITVVPTYKGRLSSRASFICKRKDKYQYYQLTIIRVNHLKQIIPKSIIIPRFHPVLNGMLAIRDNEDIC